MAFGMVETGKFGVNTEFGLTPEEVFFGRLGVNPTPSVTTRNFVSGNPSNQAYIGIDTPRTASGGFAKSIQFTSVTGGGGNQTLLSGPNYRLQLRGSDGAILLSYRDTSNQRQDIAFNVTPSANVLHTMSVSLSGNNYTVTVGSQSSTASVANNSGFETSAIYRNVSGIGGDDWFFGTIANVNFISGWNQNEPFEINGSDTGLTYNNFASTDSHEYQLSSDGTQWDQVPPVNSNLPNPLVIA